MINLSTREKRLLMVLAAILIIGIFYFVIIQPVVEFKKNSDSSYEKNMARLSRLEDLNASYKELLAEKSRINAATPQDSGIAAIVDQIAGGLNISGNKARLEESPGVVQNGFQKITTTIKFEGVTINSLLEFINKLETSSATLKVNKLIITSAIKERNRYDAIITVVSLTKR